MWKLKKIEKKVKYELEYEDEKSSICIHWEDDSNIIFNFYIQIYNKHSKTWSQKSFEREELKIFLNEIQKYQIDISSKFKKNGFKIQLSYINLVIDDGQQFYQSINVPLDSALINFIEAAIGEYIKVQSHYPGEMMEAE